MLRNWRGLVMSLFAIIAWTQSMHYAAFAQALPRVTVDGRFGTKCYGTRVKQGDLCQISFYRLLANPEKYDGKYIVLTGYLTRVSHLLVLYPSRESYESDVEGEGVTLFGVNLPKELPKDMEGSIDAGIWPVLVIGVFDAKFSFDSVDRLGALRKVDTIAPVHRFDPKRDVKFVK